MAKTVEVADVVTQETTFEGVFWQDVYYTMEELNCSKDIAEQAVVNYYNDRGVLV